MLDTLLTFLDAAFGLVVYIAILIISVWLTSALFTLPLRLIANRINISLFVWFISSICIVINGLMVCTYIGFALFGSGFEFASGKEGLKVSMDRVLVSSAFNRVYAWTAQILNGLVQNTIAISQNPVLDQIAQGIVKALSALSGLIVQLGAVAGALLSIRELLTRFRKGNTS